MEVKYLSHDNIYPSIKKYTVFFYDSESKYEYDKVFQYHDFYEAQLFQCKNQSDEILGYLNLGKEKYPLYHNTFVLINLFERHQIVVTNQNCSRYCLDISPSILHFASSQDSNLLVIFNENNSTYPVRILNEVQGNALLKYFNDFQDVHLQKGFDIHEKGVILLLLAQLYDIYYEDLQSDNSSAKHLKLIFDIIQFIDLNIAEEISLEALANELHFSTYYLCRTFKKHTGFTLGKYILDKKMEIAKKTIIAHQPVDVAKMVGFNNYSNFYRSFKKSTGMSPSEFKNANSEKR